ncbi:MAG TPA: DNA polymerase III subunit alpha, partial [Afipia sp.]|nr:DNA polymerase III subunit alpha [Afipia sp.]
ATQPITGCAMTTDFGDQDASARNALQPARLVLLATSEDGYRSLMKLNSRAFLETPVNQPPHIKIEWLEGETAGLIALTGGPEGPIGQAINADQPALAQARCDILAKLFGDRLYIELQRHGLENERRVEPALIDMAYAMGLPLVATNQP